MKISKGVTSALLVAAMGIASGTASAFTGPCDTELNAVETAIQTATFLGQRATTDKSNMLAKLDAAEAKVLLGKFSDAVDKLTDISDKATELANAPKPKLSEADATGINSAVAGAISCVGQLKP